MRTLAAFPLMLVLCGCVSTNTNDSVPGTSASTQMLTTYASEQAAAGVNITCGSGATESCIPAGSKIFITAGNLALDDVAQYAIEALGRRLEKSGLVLGADLASADFVVHLRFSAEGINQLDRAIGVPATSVPIGYNKLIGDLATVNVPQMAFPLLHQRTGVVEYRLGVNDKTGKYVIDVRVAGVAQVRDGQVMTGLLSGQALEKPEVATRGYALPPPGPDRERGDLAANTPVGGEGEPPVEREPAHAGRGIERPGGADRRNIVRARYVHDVRVGGPITSAGDKPVNGLGQHAGQEPQGEVTAGAAQGTPAVGAPAPTSKSMGRSHRPLLARAGARAHGDRRPRHPVPAPDLRPMLR